MSVSNTTPIGAAQEITETKKGRNLNERLIEFSDAFFENATNIYWDQTAEELEDELEEKFSSELEDTGLEILQNRYDELERELDEQLKEMEALIGGLGIVGRSTGMDLETSYELGLNLANAILRSRLVNEENNILYVPGNADPFIESYSKVADIVDNAPDPVYEAAEEVQESANEAMESALKLYDIDVPDEQEIIEYRQSQGSN